MKDEESVRLHDVLDKSKGELPAKLAKKCLMEEIVRREKEKKPVGGTDGQTS
jgi:hypothetical protein